MRERRTALHSVLIYALAIGLVSGANFLAVPMLLALLGHEEFGRWALLEPILLAALPLAGFGIQIGLLRRVGTDASATATATAVGALLPVHLGSAVLVGVAAGGIALFSGVDFSTAALLGAIIAVESTLMFFVSLWRAEDRPILFASVEGGRALGIAASLGVALLLLGTSSGVTSEYLWLRAALASAALLLAVAIVRPRFRPDPSEARSAIGYGAPIVVASMLAALLISVDRYALANVDAAAISPYVAHVKLAQLLSVAVAAFFTWFAPKAIQRLGDGAGAHAFFVGSTTAFLFSLVGIGANVWLVTPLIWPSLFPSIAFDRLLFGILLAGIAIFALGNPLSLAALRPGKTHYAVVVTFVAVAIGGVASIVLGQLFGSVGVAVGRGLGFIAYTAAFALSTMVSLRIRYPWALYGGVGLCAAAACFALETLLAGESLAVIAIRIVLFNMIYAGLLWRSATKNWAASQQA